MSIVYDQSNCIRMFRGNIGTVQDLLLKSGVSVPVYQNLWTGTTHPISGTVKLSGVGVVGAEVIVIIADDEQLTSPYVFGVVATTAGGVWSIEGIPDGKYAYAYAQNYTGGTHYTSTGAPYVS